MPTAAGKKQIRERSQSRAKWGHILVDVSNAVEESLSHRTTADGERNRLLTDASDTCRDRRRSGVQELCEGVFFVLRGG